jgi:hypothetical protein
MSGQRYLIQVVDKFTKKNKKRPKFSFSQFRTLVSNNSEPIYRTMASQMLKLYR